MTPLDKQPLQTFRVFLEDSSGVLECIVGVFDRGRGRFLMPMATRIASGDFETITKARLEKAIRTLKMGSNPSGGIQRSSRRLRRLARAKKHAPRNHAPCREVGESIVVYSAGYGGS